MLLLKKTIIMKKLLFLSIIILGIVSCSENVIEDPNTEIVGKDYFPLEVGNEWIYQVDSILVTLSGNGNIISSSFVKEEVKELISDTNGEQKYRLERSFRTDESSEWRITDIWTISVDEDRAYRTEENLKFVKIAFPAIEGTRWDGNIFFDSDAFYPVAADNIRIFRDWEYKIESVGESRNILDQVFDQTMHISHIDSDGFTERRFSEEYYGKGIGLIEKKMKIFNSQNGDTSLSWEERAESGFSVDQKLVSFKKN